MPGTGLSTFLHILLHLILSTTLWGKTVIMPHITSKEIKAQRSNFSKSHGKEAVETGFEYRQKNSRTHAPNFYGIPTPLVPPLDWSTIDGRDDKEDKYISTMIHW